MECDRNTIHIYVKYISIHFCFQASCLLTINAFNEIGFLENTIYRLAIVIEDFPHGAIDVASEEFTRNRAMSRVPLQVL